MDVAEAKAVLGALLGRKSIWILLILLAGGLVYANSFQGRFLYDDYISIVENPRIRGLSSSVQQSSRPLTHLSFALQFRFSGLSVADFHLVNNGFHLANGVLLFLLLSILLRCRGSLAGENWRLARCVAGCIAILWVVHPIHTESVTYIAQRAELMAAFFCLATLLFAVTRVFCKPRRNGVMICVICCAIGMLTKPVMVIAPVLVLACDGIYFQPGFLAALRARKWFYGMLFLTMVIPLGLWFLPNESSSSSGSETGISSLAYFLTQPGVILHYMRLAVWPYPLCLDYGWPVTLNFVKSGIYTLSACVLCAATGWFIRRNAFAVFGLAWFLITIAPSSSFFPLSDIAAEHRMYLPLAGLLVLVASGIVAAITRMSFRVTALAATGLIVAGIAVLLGVLTRARNLDYADDERIWAGVVKERPENLRGYIGLGAVLAKKGQWDRAHRAFAQVALRIPDPKTAKQKRVETDYAIAMRNLGITSFQLGFFAEADACFSNAMAVVKWDEASKKEMEASRKHIAQLMSAGKPEK